MRPRPLPQDKRQSGSPPTPLRRRPGRRLPQRRTLHRKGLPQTQRSLLYRMGRTQRRPNKTPMPLRRRTENGKQNRRGKGRCSGGLNGNTPEKKTKLNVLYKNRL